MYCILIMAPTDLVVVMRRRDGEIEQAGRDVHAVSGHGSITVTANEPKRVMGKMVIINEIWNCYVHESETKDR